jgi:UDP-N-acetylglucosamine acyltransferase
MIINPLAHINQSAKISNNVEVGAFSVIYGDVVIGEGSWIGPHVTIYDGVRIGKNCRIHAGAVLGSIPQDLKFENEYSLLEIDDNVTIREYCTLNKGTKHRGTTRIKSHALLMAYVHIAHDCIIGEYAVLANAVNLAGHITVGDHAVIGGMSAVHQFVQIGNHTMIGGGSLVRKDVPPFIKAAREPLCYVGVNSVGLKRRGFSTDEVHHIQDIYRQIFVKNNNINKGLAQLYLYPDSSHKQEIINFFQKSERGILRGLRQTGK